MDVGCCELGFLAGAQPVVVPATRSKDVRATTDHAADRPRSPQPHGFVWSHMRVYLPAEVVTGAVAAAAFPLKHPDALAG